MAGGTSMPSPSVVLGAAYCLVAGEEQVLEASIRSILPVVDYVCVVYLASGSGDSTATSRRRDLVKALGVGGLVHSTLPFTPTPLTPAQGRSWMAPNLIGAERGPQVVLGKEHDICFDVIRMREAGRLRCQELGCTHVLLLNGDECFVEAQLRSAVSQVVRGDYDCAMCLVREHFMDPRWQLVPSDDRTYVPFMARVREDMPCRLGVHPMGPTLCTRGVQSAVRVLKLGRAEIEMFQFGLVREDLALNIRTGVFGSGGGGGGGVWVEGGPSADTAAAAAGAVLPWVLGQPLPAPEFLFNSRFEGVEVVPDRFSIKQCMARVSALPGVPQAGVAALVEAAAGLVASAAAISSAVSGKPPCSQCGGPGIVRCSRCRVAHYCNATCQQAHWKVHKKACMAPESAT